MNLIFYCVLSLLYFQDFWNLSINLLFAINMGEYLPKRKDVHSINMYVRIFYKATRDDFIKVQVLYIDSISL